MRGEYDQSTLHACLKMSYGAHYFVQLIYTSKKMQKKNLNHLQRYSLCLQNQWAPVQDFMVRYSRKPSLSWVWRRDRFQHLEGVPKARTKNETNSQWLSLKVSWGNKYPSVSPICFRSFSLDKLIPTPQNKETHWYNWYKSVFWAQRRMGKLEELICRDR
jgi:hypothetical protein